MFSKRKASLNKVQAYETAKFYLNIAQGTTLAAVALLFSGETIYSKAVFAFLSGVVVYCLYRLAMQLLVVPKIHHDN